jgi:4'-phosphopantetheinyl transferase
VIRVYAIKQDGAIERSRYAELLALVSDERRQKIARYRHLPDAQRSLLAGVLLQMVIYRETGLPPHKQILRRTHYGKPYIADVPLCFNLSHSGSWVVCATNSQPVGIDVEHIGPIDVRIAERYFSATEKEWLFAKAEEERLREFYNIWAFKESFIKTIGYGLSIPLQSFNIPMEPNTDGIRKMRYDGTTYYFKQHDTNDTYVLSVCSDSGHFSDFIEYYSIEKLVG